MDEMKIKCDYCGRNNKEDVDLCLSCGAPLQDRSPWIYMDEVFTTCASSTTVEKRISSNAISQLRGDEFPDPDDFTWFNKQK
jgi:uncharacterized membrane protein YvbJ